MQAATAAKKIRHNTDHRMQLGWYLTSTAQGEVIIEKDDQGSASNWIIHPDGSIQNYQGKYLALSKNDRRDEHSYYAGLSDQKVHTFNITPEGKIQIKGDPHYLVAHRFFVEDKVANQATRVSFH